MNELIIGTIADTHDNLPMIRRAVDQLNRAKVSLVLHAGDIISPFVPRSFIDLKAPMIAIYGNNDAEKETLRKRFAEIGKEVRGSFAQVEAGRMRIAITHGDELDLLSSLIGSQYYHLIVCGHTHEAKSYVSGGTLIVNPGEVCGYLSGQATIATVDTESRRVETLRL